MATLEEGNVPPRRKNKLTASGDDPYMIVQKVGDNAYRIELPGDMNISATFNVADLTPNIADEDEGKEDLKAKSSSRRGGEVDVEQVKQSNLLNHIKALVYIGPMITFEQELQVFGLLKSLLTWNP